MRSLSSSRTRATISLVGVALGMLGFFLPMLTESKPDIYGSAHPLYEWQIIIGLAGPNVLVGSLALLSLLGMLIVLIISVASLFRGYEPWVILSKDIAAAWTLVIQLSFDFIVLLIQSTGSIHTEISWGFVVLLIGLTLIFSCALRVQTTFTPLTSVLLAVGSLIFTLAWIFFDFFAGMEIIHLYSWLPLLVLFVIVTLLMSKQWATAALSLPLVIASLYGLYYLLLISGSITWLPATIIIPAVITLLVLLNGCIFWLTRRGVKTVRQNQKGVQMRKRSSLKWLTGAAGSLVIGALFVKSYVWDDPSKQWLITDLFEQDNDARKLTLGPPLETRLGDASHLNMGVVKEIRAPKTVAEVIQAIGDAKASHRKISLSGVRHSMGGQALGQNTFHLDMTHLDSVHYNTSDQTITVGPGATWKQVQEALSPHDRAVRVMQDSNIFSVGGSLSVNAHGKDPQYGSLIESVTYIKVVTAEGKELRCDNTNNKDLFSAVIGGLGLLAIITEVNLRTTPNSVFSFSLISTPTSSVMDMLETLSQKPENRLLEAHLSIDADNFLTQSLIFKYAEVESATRPKDDLAGENSIWLRKVIFQASRISNFGKLLRWETEKYLSPLVEPKAVSRNTAMAVPVRFLQNPDPQTTDILQEYFVPTEQANDFLVNYKKLIRKYHINLLNVTIRKVNQDVNALVSYARKEMYGFVVYYKVNRNNGDVHTLDAFTRELFDYLISIEATYYLCYGSYYSQAQLTTMYPAMNKLFALKAQYDPNTLLTNMWYEKNS